MERTVCGATRQMLPRVAAFLEQTFRTPREVFDARFRNCPPANPEDSRVAMAGDRIVSHIRVYRRDLRLRGSVIPSGHLAEVCTDPDHRRQGHGRALLQDCVGYIRSLGYPLSCVHTGAHEFYTCEHWVRFPLIATTLYLSHWRCQAPPDVIVRRYRRGDDDRAVADIHEEYNQSHNLSAVRDAEYWRLHHSWMRGEEEDGFLVAEREGQPVGYCRAAHGTMIEYGVRAGHHDVGVALVDALVRRERCRRADHLQMTLPADETVITSDPQRRYTRTINEHMHLRVIDLKGILDVALRTAGDRVESVGSRTIAIEVLGQKCAIQCTRDRASVEALPDTAEPTPLEQTEFFKLVFGATMDKDLSAFSREDRALLHDLFPSDGPVYWRADVV